MTNGFNDREKAFEEKWAHDEELGFKVSVRRAKLAGLWAAAQMGLAPDKAEAFAKAAVDASLSEDGDEAVFAQIRAAFDKAGTPRSDHLIRLRLDELLAEAKNQVMHEIK